MVIRCRDELLMKSVIDLRGTFGKEIISLDENVGSTWVYPTDKYWRSILDLNIGSVSKIWRKFPVMRLVIW